MSAIVDFQNACVVPANVREQAVRSAQAAYRVARAAELALWRNTLSALHKRFNAIKHDAEHEDYLTARQALDNLKQPSDRPLREELDRAVVAADRAYHQAVAALRVQFRISPAT